jgi:hypothetical protein
MHRPSARTWRTMVWSPIWRWSRLVAEAFDKKPRVQLDDRIYNASPQKLLAVITERPLRDAGIRDEGASWRSWNPIPRTPSEVGAVILSFRLWRAIGRWPVCDQIFFPGVSAAHAA